MARGSGSGSGSAPRGTLGPEGAVGLASLAAQDGVLGYCTVASKATRDRRPEALLLGPTLQNWPTGGGGPHGWRSGSKGAGWLESLLVLCMQLQSAIFHYPMYAHTPQRGQKRQGECLAAPWALSVHPWRTSGGRVSRDTMVVGSQQGWFLVPATRLCSESNVRSEDLKCIIGA
ncbi:hypothetical protein ANO11243_055110 [Dothideomycetidae sp. 11243]|nr:hypothetical protein ANO11243_055110 [fungal sp. No.11243]